MPSWLSLFHPCVSASPGGFSPSETVVKINDVGVGERRWVRIQSAAGTLHVHLHSYLYPYTQTQCVHTGTTQMVWHLHSLMHTHRHSCIHKCTHYCRPTHACYVFHMYICIYVYDDIFSNSYLYDYDDLCLLVFHAQFTIGVAVLQALWFSVIF